jgi:hypothetical protein
MDNIIYHKPDYVSNTLPTNVKAGIINPLDRRTYKQLININTRFRNNYTITPASDFGFNLPTPLKKVVSMKVSCLNLPPTIYTVSALTGSNYFYVGRGANPDTRIDISGGSYSGKNMASSITTALPTDFSDITLTFNDITGRMTFESTSDLSFSLDFNYIDPSNCPNTFSKTGSNIYKDQLTLGWLLGFRGNYIKPIDPTTTNKFYKVRNNKPSPQMNGYLKNNIVCCPEIIRDQTDISNNYSNQKSYTSEALYNAHGNRYFLLSVNDFQNSHTISVVSPLQQETLGDGNILAKSSSSCCAGGCGTEAPTRIYFGPTDISKLHIKLYDEFGRIVDMNNGDFSITLDVEILYDL